MDNYFTYVSSIRNISTMSINTAARFAIVIAVSIGFALSASAADFMKGYTLGGNDPLQLGSDFVFDQAALGGGDAAIQTAPASFGWVAEYANLWDIGTSVSLTGLALPIHSNTGAGTNATQNGDWTITFFDLGGGADPDAFDGYNFGTMTGESIIGSATASFNNHGLGGVANQTDEYFVEFDSSIDFTAASTGLAFHLQSTNTMRVKVHTPSATRRARRVSLGDGTLLSGTNTSFAATLAGIPVAQDPPPPPTLAHRIDASLDEPGNGRWDTIDSSLETYNFQTAVSGDYNGDTVTNAADYTVWRDNDGGDAALTFTQGSRDSANSGVINAQDGTFWSSNYNNNALVDVSDPSVPGITKAYTTAPRGEANVFESQVNGLQASRQDASFEVWFKPDSLTGGDQILYEVGGTGTGSYISLVDNQLSFYVNGQFDGNEQTLTTTLTSTDWTQVVAVINNTFSASDVSDDDFIELYVDGVLVGTNAGSTTDINRWAGGNQAGLGHDAGVIAAGGPITGDVINDIQYAFDGQIAIFEYAPEAWDSTEVLARYNAITTSSSLATSVPEPSAALLLLSAGLIGLCRQRG